jgi:hypothetical protein
MTTLLGTLGVKLAASTAQFTKDLKNATNQVRDSADTIRSLTKVSGAAFAGLAGTIGLATRALGEQRLAERKLQAVAGLQNLDVTAIQNYAAELQKLTTFGDEVTITAAAMLGSFQLTQDQIVALLPRAQNLAAFMGTSLNSAALQLGKSFTMGAGSLSRMGIVMSDSEKAAFNAASQMEKVAILGTVIDKNVGNAAQTMATTAVGAFQQMQNAAGDTLEELGKIVEVPLTAIFKTITDVIVGLTDAFASLSPETKDFLGIAVLVGTAIAGIVTVMGGLGLVLPGLIAGFTAAAVAMAPIIVAAGLIALKLGILVTAIALVRKAWVDDLGGMRTKTLAFVNFVGEKWDAVTTFMGDAWDSVVDRITSLWESLGSVGQTALDLISPGLGATIRALAGVKDATRAAAPAFTRLGLVGEAAWDTLKDTALKTTDFVFDAFKELGTDIAETFGITGDEFDKLMEKIRTTAGATVKEIKPGEIEGPPVGVKPPSGAKSEAAIAKNQVGAIAEVGTQFATQLGELGQTISTAMQAWQAGGPYAAAFAVLGDLATKTQAFARVVEILNDVVGLAVEAVEPLVDALRPLANAISSALSPILKQMGEIIKSVVKGGLGPLLTALGNLFKALAPIVNIILVALQPFLEVFALVLRGLAIAVGAVALVIATIINAIIDAMVGILDFLAGLADVVGAGGEIRKFANQLRSARVDVASLERGLEMAAEGTFAFADTMAGTLREFVDQFRGVFETTEQGRKLLQKLDHTLSLMDETAAEAAAPLEDLASAAEDTSKSFREASAALTNVPQGFKIAAARFAAISAGVGLGAVGGLGGDVQPSTQVTRIESLFLQVADPEEFLRKLQELAEWQNFASTGTPLDTPPNENQR